MKISRRCREVGATAAAGCLRDVASFPLKSAHFSCHPPFNPKFENVYLKTKSLKFCMFKFNTRR